MYYILGIIALILFVLAVTKSMDIGAPFYHDWKWYLRLVAKRSIFVRWSFPRLVQWSENGIDILARRKHWRDAKRTQRACEWLKYPVVREGALFICGVFELQRLTDAAGGRKTPKDPRVDLVVGSELLMLDILCGYNPPRKLMYVPNTPKDIREFLTPKDPNIAISVKPWKIVLNEGDAWEYMWGEVRGRELMKVVAEEQKRKRYS